MSRVRRPAPSEGALASIVGGAVTSERLTEAVRREGRGGSPLIRSLLAQSLPKNADLARVYSEIGGVPRLDPSFLIPASGTARRLDAELLRANDCLPVAILDDLCVLAVAERGARRAVQAVRTALQRDVLPVLADEGAIRDALRNLGGPPRASRIGAIPPRVSPAQSRFRELALRRDTLDALALEAPRIEIRERP